MSFRRARQPQLSVWHALLVVALPSACATGVQQEFESDEDPSGAGSGSGGALITGGSGVIPDPTPKAGSTGNGGSVSNPFGGSSSTGGKASGGAGGMSGGDGGMDNEGGTAGSGGKATGGASGSSTGGASGGSGGSGSGSCGCMKTLTWMDNTVLNWSTGDCLTVAGETYKYVGTKAQTWANKDCNPTMQLAWCTDSGNDYKFMVCP